MIVSGIRAMAPQFLKNLGHFFTRTTKKRDRIRFGYDVNKHCNLNCVGCDHFAPLAKEEFADIESVKRDLVRMEELFGDNIDQISILGGEPLLNPEISDYCTMTRNIFPTSNITIITNGTLLLKMDNSFWDNCKKNNICINVTKYPVAFNYDAVERRAKENGVYFKYQGSGQVVKKMYCVPIDEKGGQDPRISFRMCEKGNGCITLEDGHLYTCTLIPNIRIFNEAFRKNLEVSENDSIDIYSDVSAEEILERLSKPVSFCRYCNQFKYKTGIKWKTSTKSIDEWM